MAPLRWSLAIYAPNLSPGSALRPHPYLSTNLCLVPSIFYADTPAFSNLVRATDLTANASIVVRLLRQRPWPRYENRPCHGRRTLTSISGEAARHSWARKGPFARHRPASLRSNGAIPRVSEPLRFTKR